MSNQRIYQNAQSQTDGKISDSYRTPKWLIDWIDDEYSFTCDAAASDENHLFDNYYTETNSALTSDWSLSGGHVFCNPPFSNGFKEAFLAKAFNEMTNKGVSSVFLIPADITNKCWLDHIYGKATKITAINGRVKFIDPVTLKESKAGLGVAIVEFQHGEKPVEKIEYAIRDDIRKKFDYKFKKLELNNEH